VSSSAAPRGRDPLGKATLVMSAVYVAIAVLFAALFWQGS
jgi:hypothetical protein